MKAITSVLTTITLGSLLATAGCGKKKEEPAPAGDKAGGASMAGGERMAGGEKKPAAGPDFAAWDTAGKKKAWTGSWVAKDNGSWQAWTVGADGKVQVRDGEKDETYNLEVEIPCYAYFANEKGMKFPHPFTVKADGKIHTSGSGGGYRKGSEAIFCDGSGSIFVLAADGKCTTYKDDFGKWVASPGECSLAKSADGKDVFKHGDPNGGEFAIDGDAIIAGSNPTESAADHEAAKAAALAKK